MRKQVKRTHETERVRQKDWLIADPDDPDAWDEAEIPQFERVMPRGERERRQAVMDKALARVRAEQAAEQPAGAEPPLTELPATSAPRGTVIEVSASLCRVSLADRQFTCSIDPALSAAETGFTNIVAVGDKVLITIINTDRGIVRSVLPRRSVLARADWHDDYHNNHLRQVIVANADQLLIVSAWREPAIWLELIDRYLIGAHQDNLLPIICVNKTDLSSSRAECEAALAPYRALGHRLLFTSAVAGEGIAELRDILRGRMTVLAGLSGVGKSSLLTAVQPGLNLRVAETSARRHEGKHTTTQVNLFPLEIGGYVVDTPGIRSFELSGMTRKELVAFYPEIMAVQEQCRFANCTHQQEPGCAVRPAVAEGRISPARFHNYQKIYAELAA